MAAVQERVLAEVQHAFHGNPDAANHPLVQLLGAPLIQLMRAGLNLSLQPNHANYLLFSFFEITDNTTQPCACLPQRPLVRAEPSILRYH